MLPRFASQHALKSKNKTFRLAPNSNKYGGLEWEFRVEVLKNEKFKPQTVAGISSYKLVTSSS